MSGGPNPDGNFDSDGGRRIIRDLHGGEFTRSRSSPASRSILRRRHHDFSQVCVASQIVALSGGHLADETIFRLTALRATASVLACASGIALERGFG